MATTYPNLSSLSHLGSRIFDPASLVGATSPVDRNSPVLSPHVVPGNSTQIRREITRRLNQLTEELPEILTCIGALEVIDCSPEVLLSPDSPVLEYSGFPHDLCIFEDKTKIIESELVKWDRVIHHLSLSDCNASLAELEIQTKYFREKDLLNKLREFRRAIFIGFIHSERLQLIEPSVVNSLETCIAGSLSQNSRILSPQPRFQPDSHQIHSDSPQISPCLSAFRPTGQVLVENENRFAHPSQAPAKNPFLNRPFPVRPSPPENSYSVPYQKLPKFDEIPLFSGDLTAFKPFWDNFEPRIHLVPAPAYEKMIRLQHALKGGSAAYIVENRARTLEDYESVITILTTRYLDQSKIEDFLEFELLAISPPVHDDSRSLLEFADKIDTFKSRFRHNRSEIPRNVVKKLFYKLDTETRRHATLRSSVKGYDLNNVDDFLKFLYELAAETEKWFFASGKENVKPQTRSNPVVTPKNHFRIHGSVDTPSGCPFCSENHKASDCSKVKSYDARMQSLKSQRKCYRCFDPNHLSSACEGDFSCEKCGKNHHTFMCPPRDPPVISPRNSVPVSNSESNALCFTIMSKSEPPSVFPSQVGTKFCMLSVNCQCSKSVPPNPVNLFVDCGSDINFMKKSAVISDIPLVFYRNLTVSSFHGSVRVKSCRLNVIFTPNQNQRFKFVPEVPPNQVVFPVQVVDDGFFDRLKGSKFSRDVDVLLGVDAMMALQFAVTEYRSDAGYQLVKTSLGYFEAGARSPYTQLHPTNIVPPPLCPTSKCDGTDGKQRRSCPAPEIASGQLMEKSKWPPECHDFACEFAYSHGMTDKLL